MADYSVKLIITNESNNKNISSETTVGEEKARELWDSYHSITGAFPFLTVEDIC